MRRTSGASCDFSTKPLQWRFLVEAAGGTASDGQRRILTIKPKELHERTPVFMGSPDDVADALRFAGS